MSDNSQRVEDRVVEALLALAVLASIVGNVFSIPVQWQIPLIFLALYGIFKAVQPTRQLRVDTASNGQALATLQDRLTR